MSISSFWEQDELKFKRLPTLQDLLRVCDRGLFEEVVLREHGLRSGSLDERSREVALGRIDAALEAMGSLDVRAEAKANRQLVLLPEESFVLHAPSLLVERRLAATLVSLDDDLPVVLRAQGSSQDVTDVGRVKCEEAAMGAEKGFWLPRRDFTLTSWEETLAYRVWLGGPWCCRERYLVLASAFWEMTYYGFEYDRAFAHRSRAQARTLLVDAGRDASPGAASPPDGRVWKAGETDASEAFGLRQPDHFELDYRDRLAWRVDSLNRDARQSFHTLVLDVARRVGRT